MASSPCSTSYSLSFLKTMKYCWRFSWSLVSIKNQIKLLASVPQMSKSSKSCVSISPCRLRRRPPGGKWIKRSRRSLTPCNWPRKYAHKGTTLGFSRRWGTLCLGTLASKQWVFCCTTKPQIGFTPTRVSAQLMRLITPSHQTVLRILRKTIWTMGWAPTSADCINPMSRILNWRR